MEKTRYNILPVPTFGKLGVNHAERDTVISETEEYRIESGGDELIIQYNDSDNSSKRTELILDPNAKVRLVRVFDRPEPAVSELKAVIAEGAELELTELYIGGRDTVSGIDVRLDGRRASFKADIAYTLSDEEKLDINLVAEHNGKKSTSEIAVGGVLSDRAAKVFKGTIDFKQGASGAVGSEREEVLLLSENVVNKTVPVILCAEEDVEGNHGATIGRIDERHIFYMKSRGIPEEKIYELTARSRLMRVIKQIESSETQKQIFEALGWGDDDEQ